MPFGGYNAAMERIRPVLRSPELRALEAEFADVEPRLMERAGRRLADCAASMAGTTDLPILVAAGPGNNGGDGFVAARLLQQLGREVAVLFLGSADRLPTDARVAHDTWVAAGGEIHATIPPGSYALIIDALFGIGLTRPLAGRAAELIDELQALNCPILAVDVPSGLDADSGRILGRALHADRTLTFIAEKPGLFTGDGPDCCGVVELADLGIPRAARGGYVNGLALFRHALRARPANSHKGSFGSVAVIGGAPGMAGAALLAGRAALRLGAGRVYVGLMESLPVDPMQPELMLRDPTRAMAAATVAAIGPGLGDSPVAVECLRQAIATDLPLVIDADGLNLLAAHPVLLHGLARRTAQTLLTPHPAEAARLLGTQAHAIQDDRLTAALDLARQSQATVILKGCGTIVATADGRWYINTTGNPGLATAGSGDVLTGILAALLGQGWPPLEAALAGVHLHGAAADVLVAGGVGPVGLTAGELIDAARALQNRWIADA